MQISSNNNAKQSPPPLPPLPPALASKYYVAKTLLLDQEQLQSRLASVSLSGEEKMAPPLPPFPAPLDQVDNNSVGLSERKMKAMSTCSDLDVYFKDYINSAAPQIDTNSNSEAASTSGGEMSGETFASPILNNASASLVGQLTGCDSTNFESLLPGQEGLLVQTLNNVAVDGVNVAYLNSTVSSCSTNNGTDSSFSATGNNGLLSIDSSRNDERSASFIDSKCKNIIII